MKIILTIDFSPWSAYSGGAQRSTHNLAMTFARRGHDVTVVYTKPPWEHIDVPAVPYTLRWATFFARQSRRQALLRPLNAWSVARVVGEILAEHSGAVVHSNGEEGGRIGRLRRRHRFGFVATPRHPHYPTAWQGTRPMFRQRLRRLIFHGKYVMQGRAAREADLCVPPSAFAARIVQQAFGVEAARLRVVHNGVPAEFLRYERDVGRAADGPLVFFGRFEETKGVDTLVEALARLGEAAPPTLLIGKGTLEADLRERIRVAGLGDRVRLLPWMTHDELAETLTTARLAALPSRVENFSLAVLSALAVGVPTISTTVGGTPEIITHDETGLLVAPGCPDALADAIARLLAEPTLAESLAEAGRRRVREQLTWEAAAAAFERLYRTLPHVEATAPAMAPPRRA